MNGVVHFEIPADDMERARKFYSLFGWDLQDYPMPDGSKYIGVRTVPVDEATHMPKEAGAINGGMMQRSEKVKAPVFAINVSSVDDYVSKVEAAGGKVVMPKTEMGGMGYYAYVMDTESNVIGLWESIKKS
jgi:uncharacterized protein